MKIKTISLILAVFLISGCAVISKNVLKEVDTGINMTMVQERPDEYIGKKVVWGGTILASENKEKETEIEVLESELAFDYSPKDGDSMGRFIIESTRYLDTKVYKPNKRITVAGTIKAVEVRKIGKMDYPFPIITPIEMKLLEPPEKIEPYQQMAPYMYGPYMPYGPYYPYPYGPSPFSPFPYGPYPYGPYPYRPFPY